MDICKIKNQVERANVINIFEGVAYGATTFSKTTLNNIDLFAPLSTINT
jgi:hypothetical protein